MTTTQYSSVGSDASSAHVPLSKRDAPPFIGLTWDFLEATTDPSAFRHAKKHTDIVEEAIGGDEIPATIWRLRCDYENLAAKENKHIDECVANTLRSLSDVDPAIRTAFDWLNRSEISHTSPSESIKRTRAIIDEWQHEAENKFRFSTDTDLDDLLGTIEWLWDKRIPRGFVTGVVGEQDTGKSTVMQDFCHTLLLGGRWPDGQICKRHNGKLLWIDTDGNLALFHDRLKRSGVPRGSFVFPPDALQELSIDNPKNWKWIEQAIEAFSPPIIVIDALSGSHSGKENDTDSMKAIMKRLHALAQKYKIAVVVVHHLNKTPFGVPSYPITVDRLRGSSSISQFCRSILALTAPDPNNPNARRLDVIKLNLAKKPAPVGYELTDNGPAWGNAPEPPKERRVSDDAADFLRSTLADGPRREKDVTADASANGISEYALKQARKQLRVKAMKDKSANGGWWLSIGTGEGDT